MPMLYIIALTRSPCVLLQIETFHIEQYHKLSGRRSMRFALLQPDVHVVLQILDGAANEIGSGHRVKASPHVHAGEWHDDH